MLTQSTFMADFGLLLFNIQNKTLPLQKQQLRFCSFIFQPAFVPFNTPRGAKPFTAGQPKLPQTAGNKNISLGIILCQ